MNKSVYLAGPISRMSYDECTEWREYAKKALEDVGIVAKSPMRAKTHLSGQDDLTAMIEDHSFYNNNTIVSFDFFDVQNSDVILAYFKGAQVVSIGSLFEIAWCYPNRKPVVYVPDEKGLHIHPFVLAACPFIVEDLDTAIEVVKRLLLP